MNYGPLIFLGAFFALATSWFSFVLKPQFQIGQLQATNSVPGNITYPLGRAGLASQGLEVYRANGCAACHSQQVRQTGTVCDLVLTATGTNQPALIHALREILPSTPDDEIGRLLTGLPKPILTLAARHEANKAEALLKAAKAKCEVRIIPVGPDIARGWGKRQSVAEDYLYDSTVMLGSQRIGPDLANVGARLPDVNWHLKHLYDPRSVVTNSIMPSYRFLFEKRKVGKGRSPGSGEEIVPKREAIALAAYLTSLQSDASLFIAPYSGAAQPPAPANNAPAATASGTTNAPAAAAPQTNAPAK
jgi:cbb3-type cytochrome oxidase cytochrome c subunit